MRVAVIMSTYNGEKYLSEQIESILNQSNVDVDLYIRDDGSTDHTVDIINNYLISHKNIYINRGINIGFRQSFIYELIRHDGYDYYAFSDQDDFWETDKLVSACKIIQEKDENSKPIVYYSNLNITNESLQIYKKTKLEFRNHSLESAVMRRSIAGCTMVMNHSMWAMIAEKKITDKMLRRGHDSFIISLCYSVGGIVLCDSNAYIRYRQHDDNASGGVHGPKQRIAKEWKAITMRKGQESEIADAILVNWEDEIEPEKKCTLEQIRDIKKISSRVCVFFSPKFTTGDLLLTAFAKIKVLVGLL